MGSYCYKERRGKRVITKVFPCDDIPKSIVEKGVRYDRSYEDEWNSQSVASTAWNGGLHCYASGVHPSQRKELEDYLAKRGVPTKVDAEGNPIYTSKEHRKRALKARGMHDNAGYY